MAKLTTQRENLKKDYPEIFNTLIALENYVRADLRKRFDDERDSLAAINIIDETRFQYGFTDLADEMISDFCVDDEALWNIHEAGRKRDKMAEQMADNLFEHAGQLAAMYVTTHELLK